MSTPLSISFGMISRDLQINDIIIYPISEYETSYYEIIDVTNHIFDTLRVYDSLDNKETLYSVSEFEDVMQEIYDYVSENKLGHVTIVPVENNPHSILINGRLRVIKKNDMIKVWSWHGSQIFTYTIENITKSGDVVVKSANGKVLSRHAIGEVEKMLTKIISTSPKVQYLTLRDMRRKLENTLSYNRATQVLDDIFRV